jgi:hypothetical protein
VATLPPLIWRGARSRHASGDPWAWRNRFAPGRTCSRVCLRRAAPPRAARSSPDPARASARARRPGRTDRGGLRTRAGRLVRPRRRAICGAGDRACGDMPRRPGPGRSSAAAWCRRRFRSDAETVMEPERSDRGYGPRLRPRRAAGGALLRACRTKGTFGPARDLGSPQQVGAKRTCGVVIGEGFGEWSGRCSVARTTRRGGARGWGPRRPRRAPRPGDRGSWRYVSSLRAFAPDSVV